MWITITETDSIEFILNLDKVESISKSFLCNKDNVITFTMNNEGGVYYWKLNNSDDCNTEYEILKNRLITNWDKC